MGARSRLWLIPIVLVAAAIGLPSLVVASGRSAAGSATPQVPALTTETALVRLTEAIQSTGALAYYRDPTTDQIVVVVPRSGSSSFKAAMADPMLNVEIQQRDIEPSDVAAIKKRVVELASDDAGYGFAAIFDPSTGKVRVKTNAPSEELSQLERDYPGQVTYDFGKPPVLDSRYTDVGYHWGGAQMMNYVQGEYCTSGFGVLNSNGYDRMVTAAHCGQLGDPMTSVYGTSFGTVVKRTGYPDNDFELVGDNSIGQGHNIYVGGMDENTHVGVADAGWPSTYTAVYCYSGVGAGDGGAYAPDDYRSLVECGYWFTDLDAPFCPGKDPITHEWEYPGDHCADHTGYFEGHTTTWCPQGGDSGSPVYLDEGGGYVGVRGILVGHNPDCDPADGFVMLWPRIQSEYGVTIKTGAP